MPVVNIKRVLDGEVVLEETLVLQAQQSEKENVSDSEYNKEDKQRRPRKTSKKA
jgi:hypothetical protein